MTFYNAVAQGTVGNGHDLEHFFWLQWICSRVLAVYSAGRRLYSKL